MEGLREQSISDTNSSLVLKALETLVVDNPDLERLEALLDLFNIFEAIGAIRQELRHSDFLAFLLSPQQNHGLGDAFLKRLLQKALPSGGSKDALVTPIDLDVWGLDQALVLREWQNIDILVLDEAHRLAVIIENKIDSSEHSTQLQRYRQTIAEHYPNWQVLGLYLTPDGEIPSDESYLPVDYGLVCQLLESMAQSRVSTLGRDVLTLINHYTEMLRRHIVGESELAELCRRIYQKHQRALDLIYEYRPDRQIIIQEVLQKIIKQTPELESDSFSKKFIYFARKEWDKLPGQREGTGWTSSKRILLFRFDNSSNNLKLRLFIGPGSQEVRQRFFDGWIARQLPFKPAPKKLADYYCIIYSRPFLSAEDYEDASDQEVEGKINKQWTKFVEDDLPQIAAAFRSM